MLIFEDLVILLAVLLDYSVIKTSGVSLWLITYGECFAESSPETQIGLRITLLIGHSPSLVYNESAYLFKDNLPAAPEAREQTSELSVCPHTVTDPLYGKPP